MIIPLSDLFNVTIDELLRSDKELKDKVIKDSKQLEYPKWKMFFESVFSIGVLLLVAKLIIFLINKFGGTAISLEGLPTGIVSFLPVVLMLVGGIGADQLKNKYL